MQALSRHSMQEDLVRRIFVAAVAVPKSLRGAWLDVACEGDAEVRARVDRLLGWVQAEVQEDSMVGTTLGRWLLLRALGRGGIGRVYEGVASGPWDGPVRAAIKITKSPIPLIEAGQTHPRLTLLIESGDEPCPWVAMPLVPHAEPILDAAAAIAPTAADRTRLVMDACDVVATLHDQGMVHGDLSPGNLLVDGDGHVHVIDLDLASDANAQQAGRRGGTPGFIAPECYEGLPTPASDVYALAGVLYRLLSGHNPYPSPKDQVTAAHVARELRPVPLSHFAPGLPEGLEAVVAGSLSKEPGLRPPDARALEALLRSALAGERLGSRRATGVLLAMVVLMVAAVGRIFAPETPSLYEESVLADAPVGFWRLNERRTADPNRGTAGDRYDGVWSGDVDVGAGGIDGAAYFDAGALTIPSGLPIHLNGPMSIELWFRLPRADAAGTTYLLSKGRDTGAGFYRISVGRGRTPGSIAVRAAGRNGTTPLDAQVRADADAWHHLVWACGEPEGLQHLWLDGEVVATQPVPGGLFGSNDHPMLVGRHGEASWAFHHRGWVDEVAVYRGVLSQAAIRLHHDAGRKASGSERTDPATVLTD